MVKGQPQSLIYREKPIVTAPTRYPLTFDWNFLAAAGSLVLYAGLIAFLLMRARRASVNFLTVYVKTVRQLGLPIATIALILAIAQLMNYSGMTSSMAIALSKTGFIFPFVAAFLGWLGVLLPARGADRSAPRLERDLDRRHQLVRGCDGQDDQPAEPVGRSRRGEQGRRG